MSARSGLHGARIDAPPAAVVIGLDSITGLQSARVLAGHGIPVIGVAQDARHPSCRTNTCRRILYTRTSGDDLVAALEQLGQTLTPRAVLFPCTDLSVLALSQARETLGALYHMALPPPGVLERLLDKATFHAYAVDAGLPVAGSQVVRHRDDLEVAIGTLRFPCVLKPAVKTPEWLRQTSAKVFRADDGEALRRAYERCAAWSEQFIVQEWIDGVDTAHVTCNAYFGADSTPLVTFVSQKLRQWPLEGGVGCFSQECRNDEVLEHTVRLFQGIGHRGLAYLEMKRDSRTGRLMIIEPNVGRPTGRSAAAEAAGVNLLYTQYCDVLNLPLPAGRQQPYGQAKWVYFRQDCQAAFTRWRQGTLSASDWLRSLRGCGSDAVFSWRDPGPFVADVARGIAKVCGGRTRYA
jgi:D-aspartate ligase